MKPKSLRPTASKKVYTQSKYPKPHGECPKGKFFLISFLKRLKAIDLKKGRIRHIQRAKKQCWGDVEAPGLRLSCPSKLHRACVCGGSCPPLFVVRHDTSFPSSGCWQPAPVPYLHPRGSVATLVVGFYYLVMITLYNVSTLRRYATSATRSRPKGKHFSGVQLCVFLGTGFLF